MSKEKHIIARQQLGLFFARRREEMGHSQVALAKFVGISANTLHRIELGKFDYDIGLLFVICEALEIKPFFVKKESEGDFVNENFNISFN